MTEQEAIKEIRNCLGFNNIIMPYSDEMDAFGMAIAALEKQIPKKPICIEDKVWTCSTCGNNLLLKWLRYPEILQKPMNGQNYCMSCGHKIDWSDME